MSIFSKIWANILPSLVYRIHSKNFLEIFQTNSAAWVNQIYVGPFTGKKTPVYQKWEIISVQLDPNLSILVFQDSFWESFRRLKKSKKEKTKNCKSPSLVLNILAAKLVHNPSKCVFTEPYKHLQEFVSKLHAEHTLPTSDKPIFKCCF